MSLVQGKDLIGPLKRDPCLHIHLLQVFDALESLCDRLLRFISLTCRFTLDRLQLSLVELLIQSFKLHDLLKAPLFKLLDSGEDFALEEAVFDDGVGLRGHRLKLLNSGGELALVFLHGLLGSLYRFSICSHHLLWINDVMRRFCLRLSNLGHSFH